MSNPASTPPLFIATAIHELRAETPEHLHLELAPSPEFLSAYTLPGQYVQIQIEGLKPGFFAIAGGPARERLEFFIKRGTPVSDAIGARKKGETLHVSAPAGKGYALPQAVGRDVFAVGAGSGLAPLRALIHTLLARRAEFGRIHLIYGARKASLIPYSSELAEWKSVGVTAQIVCSQPEEGTWTGPVGRVQASIQHLRPSPDSAVFVCGMKPMVEGVKAAFGELGVSGDRIFQNF